MQTLRPKTFLFRSVLCSIVVCLCFASFANAQRSTRYGKSILGTLAPQNQASARKLVAPNFVTINKFDSQVAITASPNQQLQYSSVPNGSLGYITLRRRFTNNTGRAVTQLRIRFLELITKGGGAEADARLISAVGGQVRRSDGQHIEVVGLELENAPLQPQGGGVNSTARAATITLATPLAPTALNNTVDVALRLGVERGGRVRYFYIIEAAF